jgi:hypothetical protein
MPQNERLGVSRAAHQHVRRAKARLHQALLVLVRQRSEEPVVDSAYSCFAASVAVERRRRRPHAL